jgi:histidinol-phosphatase (PHP family)
MNFDYHIHSMPFSPDSSAQTAMQIERALELGLKEICITDHLEVNLYPDEQWSMDTSGYYDHYKRLETKGLCVKLGVEAGISCADEDVAALEEKLGGLPLDFVIASAHVVNGVIPFSPRYYEGKFVNCVFGEYIKQILTGIKRIDESLYSCVGHIDFPTKGAFKMTDPRMHYSYVADELDELFRYLIPRGKCIEINTSSYRGIGDMEIPGADWLGRYVELGGEFVTFGSDAHIPDQVGYRLKEAAHMAKAAGVRYVATYDKMQPVLHRL